MAFKAIIVLCASALMVSAISGHCISSFNNGCGGGLAEYGGLANINLGGCNAGYGLAGNNYAANLGNIASLNGGELLVSSSSALAPGGLSVRSENALEGVVNVAGALPFLSAVALEGQVPSGGSAGVSYSYGNGNIGIVGTHGGAAAGGLGYGAGVGNVGFAGNGLAGCGQNIGLQGSGLGLGSIGLGGGCGCGLY